MIPVSQKLLILVLYAAVLLTGGVSSASELHEIRGETMGTTYLIKWTDSISDEEQIQQLVDARLVVINRLMSTYDPESELSRFNRHTGTDWFDVSPETALVVEAALEMGQLSGGAFDPTVGRLVRLWNFGSGPRIDAPPAPEEIEKALQDVGYQYVKVRREPPALAKERPGVELDLSAIAKGYGVDAVLAVLEEHGLTNAMVEIGGEVRVVGTKGGEPWTLGIERPEELTRSLHAKVELRDEALATSGDYRNYFENKGVRYSHTIDPRTGRPVTHQLASASVLAQDCMTADAWATTLMVLGAQQGLELTDTHGVKAYLLQRNGEGFRELASREVVGQFVNLTQVSPQEDQTLSPLVSTFLLTLSVFGIALLGLAAGVIFSNRTLKGSCGGVAGTKDAQGKSVCEMCTTPPEECDQFKEKLRQQLTASDQASSLSD